MGFIYPIKFTYLLCLDNEGPTVLAYNGYKFRFHCCTEL